MPGCVLHVVGKMLDPQTALAGLTLQPYSVFHKGDRVFPESARNDKIHEVGGFKCDVSAPSSDLAQEVAEAIQFLSRYEADLRRLGSVANVESISLDFGYDVRIDGEQCVVQCDLLPPELLRLCGSLGIGITLSLYSAS
jgi:hypothetical protein